MTFKEWYKSTIGKLIPEYGVIPLLTCFLVNDVIYWGTQYMMASKKHYDFTSAMDKSIPFVKEWIVIYLVCYVFWAYNYILISREGKEKWYRFVFADLLSRLICGFFFIILPTTNIRPIVEGNDIFSFLVKYIYHIDQPTDLFPSIHCLVSWFCYIGIRKSKKVKLWYKVFSLVFAIMVCASTQFTKQHYLIDIAGGILIAELCYFMANHTSTYLGIKRFFTRIDHRIFGAGENDE